jgi:ubiquinone/menaquinone biosynthesis C-methylase UbiE
MQFMTISMPMPTCPVCGSTSLRVMRKLVGVRSKKSFDLFKCKDCGSLYNPSGYKEEDINLAYDLTWHIQWIDHNMTFARNVLNVMKDMHRNGKEILDIGAGIGSLMRVAREFGLIASGVEPNPYAVLYAKRVFSLDIVCAFFDNNLFSKNFDFITIISVFEHLTDPRTLLEKAKGCLKKEGVLFVSVPIYDPLVHYKFLMNPELDDSIFSDSDVHILHFTDEGFKKFARQCHATYIKEACGGYLLKFD